MASAVTHTDKTTTPLTYHYTQLLFYLLLSLHLIRSYFFIYFRLYALQEVVLLVVLLFLTLLLVNPDLCYIM